MPPDYSARIEAPADPRLWPLATELPPLITGDVHLWSADLDAIEAGARRLPLDSTEHARAAAFYFPQDAHRFRIGIWMRRSILGLYLGEDPACIRFRAGPHDRPELAGSHAPHRLRFNASHSGGIAVLALTLDNDVGVDVEIPRPLPDLLEIARDTFHPSEWAAIAGITDDIGRTAAFYRCWTRKEAIAKAVGLGLNLPFQRFAVEIAPIEAPVITTVGSELCLDPSWSLRDFSAPPQMYGAVATTCAPRLLLRRSWHPEPHIYR